MQAAVQAVRGTGRGTRRRRPPRWVPRTSAKSLREIADEVICARQPARFNAVAQWYINFAETSDEEVDELLNRARLDARSLTTMSDHACDVVRNAAQWFEPSVDGLGPILDQIGDARLVFIGEATHGTQEFYAIRAELTRALITRKGFNIVAVEADWPEAYRANRYVRQQGDDRTAEQALSDFQRFPRWMWRNTETVSFLEWLRQQNGRRPEHEQRRLLRARSL